MSQLKSMTGFGSFELRDTNGCMKVSIKAVNRKGFDISLWLPSALRDSEAWVREKVSARAQRGSLSVNVDYEGAIEPSSVSINLHTWQKMVAEAKHACEQTNLATDQVLPSLLASWSSHFGLFNKTVSQDMNGILTKSLQIAMEGALAAFDDFRAHEGSKLQQIMRSILAEAVHMLDQLRLRTSELVQMQIKKLKNRLEVLGVYQQSDPHRWAMEVALLADKGDVQEELDRLLMHLEHFGHCLEQGPFPVGRRLDFLSQEMVREINTLVNKAQDFSVSQLGVDIKVSIERLREQLQNVE